MTNKEQQGFTVKEILIDQSQRMDKGFDEVKSTMVTYMADQREKDEKQDEKIENLEIHRARLSSNFKLAGWIVSGSGLAGVLLTILMILL